jgi:biopolymer transport protein ExbB
MLSERLLEFSLVGAEWVLWVIVGLSVISLMVIGDRLVFYARTREHVERFEPLLTAALGRRDWAGARSLLEKDSLVRNVLRAGLDLVAGGRSEPEAVEQAMLAAMVRERARYDRRLIILATIGNNAPFVGLFGTVLGIIMAFHQLGQMGAASGSANSYVMGAIGEALVATAAGIIVAIPAVAAYNFAKGHVVSRAKQAEALMRSMLAVLKRPEAPASGASSP